MNIGNFLSILHSPPLMTYGPKDTIISSSNNSCRLETSSSFTLDIKRVGSLYLHPLYRAREINGGDLIDIFIERL